LVIVQTCVYDAWSVYDAQATPTIASGIPKVPTASITQANINASISYAAYRGIYSVFYGQPAQVVKLNDFFAAKGYDRYNSTEDVNTALGIGNLACRLVIQARREDGMNQYGTEYGGLNMPYIDYTGYVPTNPPQTTTGITDCSKLVSRNKWQPLKVDVKTGGTITQKWGAAQTPNVVPFALSGASEFRPRGPPLYGGPYQDQYVEQFTQVLNYSATLDDQQKTVAEFWADGPASTLPPGHWHHIALESIYHDRLALGPSVKLLFLQANAVLDAAIASWDAKRWWDSIRPITAIQCLYQNQQVKAWLSPYMGVGMINGSEWKPYQNRFFVTPGFSGYISGHSTFSAASAEVLRQFFGNDQFRGISYTITAGSSIFEPRITAGNPGHVGGVTDVANSGPETIGYSPATDITLSWNTWTEAAEQAGLSRLYGGIHISSDNVDGLDVGTKVGKKVYEKAMILFGGQQDTCNCPDPVVCPTIAPESQPCERVSSASNYSLQYALIVLLALLLVAF